MSEEGDEYERVFGVEFKHPDDDGYGLNDESITDARMYMLFAALGIIPYAGLIVAMACLCMGFMNRHRNEYRIDEQIWKAGVVAGVLQVLSAVILFIVLGML